MRSILFKYWCKIGFVLIPDLYHIRLKQSSLFIKLCLYYDIINLKRLYKIERKKTGITNALKNVFCNVDVYILKYCEQKNFKMTCTKSCAYCCSKEVFISDDEAKVLYEYAIKNNVQIDISRAHYQALNKFNVPTNHKTCIFLDMQSKECKVYEVRPLSCRTLLAFSDPQFCFDNRFGKPQYFLLPKIENIKTAIWNSSVSGILPAMIMKQIQDYNNVAQHR